jgi:glucokinase
MSQTPEEAWAIGLDVGGTKTAGGLVRFPSGEVIARRRVPTGELRSASEILTDAVEMARELARAVPAGGRLAGIGLGVPELVDLNGQITTGSVIDWRSEPLANRFSGIGPVWAEADVRAAALAEAIFGAGRPYQLFVYVSIGTGISSTFVQDGRPYAGARGNALVLASSPLSTLCPQCETWVRTTLEEFASGPGIARRYNLGQPATSASQAEHVLAAASRGDPSAAQIVREAGEALGAGVGFLVNVLDPQAVVIGGGLGLAGGLYWETLVESTRRHIWADATRDLPILPAALASDAGFVGAAAHAWLRSG